MNSILHPELMTIGIAKKHLLRNDDGMFVSMGTKNFATDFNKNNKPAIASTYFFVIRQRYTKVLTEYLAWLFYQPNGMLFSIINIRLL